MGKRKGIEAENGSNAETASREDGRPADRKQKSKKADFNTVKRKRQANYNLRMNAVHVQLFRLIALNFNRIFTAARMSKTCPGMQP